MILLSLFCLNKTLYRATVSCFTSLHLGFVSLSLSFFPFLITIPFHSQLSFLLLFFLVDTKISSIPSQPNDDPTIISLSLPHLIECCYNMYSVPPSIFLLPSSSETKTKICSHLLVDVWSLLFRR
ncbi:uncharacterized protein LACBIDRAFT_302777 [Laccaria bicolor S238N-H82]|uniref:Predicted protein n=1 Tax=Laccaria bicolor (strain S238N-H82 / ATCC MYA-4686) TaxID=486041 RepID=B0DIA1_LACBS|nr:uncharacterized protein LACBIDRAFT_302777 [Laccaria bicolor S238N-H82]EDR05647.1 predicted protein [Laccaria bicolor S238N-H82]|eukprot:XP_001883751.1 predicted protein [Laccaria bicolor S238N-H82]